jgi:molecular chaperone IbpA
MFENSFAELFPLSPGIRSKFPFYNLTEIEDGKSTIEIALAGYKKSDIKVRVEADKLIVESDGHIPSTKYVTYGIATRQFKVRFQLYNGAKVDSVSYTDGILKIDLVTEEKDSMYFDIK